jgi:signal transduction histidine kinase
MSEFEAGSHGRDRLLCPQCNSPLQSDERTCPECGVDLVLLSLLTERANLEGLPGAAPLQQMPQALVPRLGETLLEQGLITTEQLEQSLKRQSEEAQAGKNQLLGQTLIDMKMIDAETLDRAINEQILTLHAALQESNRTLEQRVTDRTAELRRALSRLTEINQIKANLISNVSHELRTPLAHVKGYIELMIDEDLGELTAMQKDAMAVMRRASERLERLIEDLIEFSAASREGLTLKLQPVEVSMLLKDILLRSKSKAEKANISLDLRTVGELPHVLADPERLSWILFQLVDNGIKFTPAGGQVTVGASSDQRFITFFVHDTGIGIPEDRMSELFEPFHQLDGSATRRYGGTGLGLALVKLILDAHGSSMRIMSTVDTESTFSFPLPIATDYS